MRIKRLEIFGFKSFMDKTVISFPPGISAIVGPNGCGKSNVLDALKWVMGEQSARQLRGKSMEDVIFSGTAGKHPLNMAEVSLTLANDNGSSPPEYREYAEIMITRKLFRSGESVYWLNKRPCRLKDIHHLLLGSGAGSRSYACIQQGNIGAITEAGPEERRQYLEEASDSTRYKSRRIETEKKLDETRGNLIRLNDILLELQKQLASLEKQKKRAEKFNKYQKKRRKAEILLALFRIRQLELEENEIRNQLVLLTDSDMDHSTRLAGLEALVQQLKTDILAKNEEISRLTRYRFEQQRQLDHHDQEKTHIVADLARSRDELDKLIREQEEIETARIGITREILEMEKREENLRGEASQIQQELKKEKSGEAALAEEIRSLSRELEDNRKKWIHVSSQEARYQQIFRSASETRHQIRRKMKQVDEEALRSTRILTELEESLAASSERLHQLSGELVDSDIREQGMRKELEAIGRNLADQTLSLRKVETQKQQVQTRYTILKKMSDNLEGFHEGVRHVMRGPQAGKRKSETPPDVRVPGIIGILADVIQAEEGYETALESALDNLLQVVLVEKMETAVTAISDLKNNGKGRCSFFPVTRGFPPQEKDVFSKHPDLLLHHIHIKPGFEEIVDRFLGHTVMVDSLEEALAYRENRDDHLRIVTRDGDIIDPSAVITGGRSDSPVQILAQKNEMNQLSTTIQALDRQLAESELRKKQLDEQLKEAENRLQALLAHHRQIRESVAREEKNHVQLEEKLNSAKRHLAIVELDQERLAGEEIDSVREIERSESLLREIQQDIDSMKQLVDDIRIRMEDRNQILDQLRQKITSLQVSRTTVEVQLESTWDTLRRIRNFQSDSADRTARIESGIQQVRQRMKECAERMDFLETSSRETREQLNRILQNLEVSETTYSAMEKRLSEHEHRTETLRQEQGNLQRQMQVRETALAETIVRREHEIRSVENRYHKTLSEYQEEMKDEVENPQFSATRWETELAASQSQLSRLQHVNTGAIQAYEEIQSRIQFLVAQKQDLTKAIIDLETVIRRINRITQEKLMETFTAVNEKLQEIFPRLFEGGSACLTLTDPDKPLETGIEFMIQPPGKRLTRISLLSGGEKALSAIAFVFSIFLIKPATFCLMDEIDAPLDEANIFRFNQLLKIIGEKSQIIMVTHNRRSMEFADMLLGVTAEKKGISRIVPVNLDRFSSSPAAEGETSGPI